MWSWKSSQNRGKWTPLGLFRSQWTILGLIFCPSFLGLKIGPHLHKKTQMPSKTHQNLLMLASDTTIFPLYLMLNLHFTISDRFRNPRRERKRNRESSCQKPINQPHLSIINLIFTLKYFLNQFLLNMRFYWSSILLHLTRNGQNHCPSPISTSLAAKTLIWRKTEANKEIR